MENTTPNTTEYGDIHGPDYRPSNVRIINNGSESHPWSVLDFDGTLYGRYRTHDQAKARANVRKGVIKAALTRRANKARAARAAAETHRAETGEQS